MQKHLRMKHITVFKSTNDVLQFNFTDHSKVILSSQGLVIAHVDKNYQISRCDGTLSEIMAQPLRPVLSKPSSTNGSSTSKEISVSLFVMDTLDARQRPTSQRTYIYV
ncbi:hypothetical protein QCA50_012525 [Cerrena zonata]|uniref:POLO box domain-containing protein n=1 Tax=Cerrena zonata TaxID=2478898 RepID=A0AAW0FTU1_9APHY